jgi:hypothetical protein
MKVLTIDTLKLSHVEVHRKPSSFPHTINNVFPLSCRVNLWNRRAILHVNVPEADPNTIPRQLHITP